MLRQACLALAVAEVELELEHRLMTPDTLLVRPTRSPRVEFTLRGSIFRVPSAGLKLRVRGLHLTRVKIGKSRSFPSVTQDGHVVRNSVLGVHLLRGIAIR